MRVTQRNASSVAVEFTRDEILAINNALNEVCHGPEAIDHREFQTRMGVEKHEAEQLLAEIRPLFR